MSACNVLSCPSGQRICFLLCIGDSEFEIILIDDEDISNSSMPVAETENLITS